MNSLLLNKLLLCKYPRIVFIGLKRIQIDIDKAIYENFGYCDDYARELIDMRNDLLIHLESIDSELCSIFKQWSGDY
jgi:hypothetical protein